MAALVRCLTSPLVHWNPRGLLPYPPGPRRAEGSEDVSSQATVHNVEAMNRAVTFIASVSSRQSRTLFFTMLIHSQVAVGDPPTNCEQ